MKKYTESELKTILENHKHWLLRDCDGWETMRANLRSADLSSANLRSADLRSADLSSADLSSANLRSADLSSANLRSADLRSADLSYADLSSANLRSADLSSADLSSANLRSADLSYADLSYADLSSANLRSADLRSADLRSANLSYARNIEKSKNLYYPYTCPDFGIFIGFKKAKNKIVALEIPEDAVRMSATGRKCRCNKAKVLGIYDYDHNLLDDMEVTSDRDSSFVYKVGEIVEVKDFDMNRWNECSTGIHFFINFQEAVNY